MTTRFTIDVNGADSLDITITRGSEGHIVWINLNGENVFRGTAIGVVQVDDLRDAGIGGRAP